MLKRTSVKKTEPVNHHDRPWVLFPWLLSTFGQFFSSHKRGIGFLSILSTSVQTEVERVRQGSCFHPRAVLSALPSTVWAVGSTPAEPLAGRGGAWWFCCQDVMLQRGCRGSHGHCLLNISDAASGEEEVVTHRSKGWASPWDWKVQNPGVLLH